MKAVRYLVAVEINLFTVLKKLKECVGFFFFNNLIATNALQISEGTNSVGIVRLDLGFCLCAVRCLVLNFFFFGGVRWVLQLTIII